MAPKKKSKSGKANSKADKAKATSYKAVDTENRRSSAAEDITVQAGNDYAEAKSPEPTLLGIPAELRNRIYRYSLTVPGKRIDVNDRKLLKGAPGLLATCRQIREEASSIFYTENDFYLEACKLHGTKARGFAKRMQKYRKDGKVVLPAEVCKHRTFLDDGDDNLRKWLKAYYDDPVLTPGVAQDTVADRRRESRTLIVRCFGVVDAMRHKPWTQVAGVLEVFYGAIQTCEDFRDTMQDHPEVVAEEEFEEMIEAEEAGEPFESYYGWGEREEDGNRELFGLKPLWW